MVVTVKKLMEQALALPQDSRLALAELLVASVSELPDPQLERKQLEEIRRRIQEVEHGQVELVPGDMVLREVREAVARAK